LDVGRWHAEVEVLTAPYREERAKALRDEGVRRRREAMTEFEASLDGPEPKDHHDGRRCGLWHMQRSKGQLERFKRVAKCETEDVLDVECTYCGRAQSKPVRCRTALVCVSCRGKIQSEKIARLAKARREAVSQVAKAGLFRRLRKGGAWSEKLVTLTIPHFEELGILERIHFLRAAWKAFAVRWNKWLRDHVDGQRLDVRGHRQTRWYRNVEWTTAEASDRLGHPHAHMWFLGPYLPGAKASEAGTGSNLVQNLWGAALESAAEGFPALVDPSGKLRADVAALCRAVVVDVRRCQPGPKSLLEVIKYLFKDLVGTAKGESGRPQRLAPETWAKVFEGFDGTRTTQGSRGLMGLASVAVLVSVNPETGEVTEQVEFGVPVKCCGKCGQTGYFWVRRRGMTAAEQSALKEKREGRRLAKVRSPEQERLVGCG
jgi:hypothetical protein